MIRNSPFKKWLFAGIWMVVIFFLSIMPIGGGLNPNWPRTGHFAEYAILGALLGRAIAATWNIGYIVCSAYAILAAIAYGILMEFVQLLAPWRSFSIEDMTMDFFGAATALVVLRLLGWGKDRFRGIR